MRRLCHPPRGLCGTLGRPLTLEGMAGAALLTAVLVGCVCKRIVRLNHASAALVATLVAWLHFTATPSGPRPPFSVHAHLDCGALVTPVDPVPVRSPQRVHSIIAAAVRYKEVVEFGTRNGDGLSCFARAAAAAAAVEMDPVYCSTLRSRAEHAGIRVVRHPNTTASARSVAGHHRLFHVHCKRYQDQTPDADVYTWWQQRPHLANGEVLAHLRRLQLRGRVRQGAIAILVFDTQYETDMDDWRALYLLAAWSEVVSVDERADCVQKLAGSLCDRAVGKWIVAGISIERVVLRAEERDDALMGTSCAPLAPSAVDLYRRVPRALLHEALFLLFVPAQRLATRLSCSGSGLCKPLRAIGLLGPADRIDGADTILALVASVLLVALLLRLCCGGSAAAVGSWARQHASRTSCGRCATRCATYVALPTAVLVLCLHVLATRERAQRCEMVVAHCREDLSWLVRDAPSCRTVWLYTKCAATLPPHLPANVVVVPTRNIGSNDYPYLFHITRHYEALAPVMVFCEAGVLGFDGGTCAPDQILRPKAIFAGGARGLWEMLTSPRPFEFEWLFGQHMAVGVSEQVDARSLAVRNEDLAFSLKQYTPRNYAWDNNLTYIRSRHANFGEWARHTWGKAFAAWLFNHGQAFVLGGFFAAEATNLRRYPCAVYAAMLAEQTHTNEEVDHYIERAWGLLLTTPRVPCAVLNSTRAATRKHHVRCASPL